MLKESHIHILQHIKNGFIERSHARPQAVVGSHFEHSSKLSWYTYGLDISGQGEPSGLLHDRQFEQLRQDTIRCAAERFAALPMSVRLQAKVGGFLYSQRSMLGLPYYEICANKHLLAVFNQKNHKLSYLSDPVDMDLSDMYFITRPKIDPSRQGIFRDLKLSDAIWLYANHDPEALTDIPNIFGTPMRLRQMPYVTPALVSDMHLFVAKKLLGRARFFSQLAAGMSEQNKQQLLACITSLLLCRCIEPI
jgi:hypothetical protein